LPCGEIGNVPTQILQDYRSIPVTRVPDHRTGPCTGRSEVGDPMLGCVGGCESLPGGGATDVSGTDEQNVQNDSFASGRASCDVR
jgi:hypothetical protein